MFDLVYVSTATGLLEPIDLQRLLTTSRAKNARLGITGVLLYLNGNFMQALEGDEAAVLALYATIEADPRHGGAAKLIARPQPERLFPEWTMAFRNLDDPALHGTPGYATLAQFVAQNPAPELDSRLVLTLLHSLVQSSR